ncbi:MAG: hypothetical protein HY589_03425 [Candidatus Omnitrophica bacterium]|nr:hypothetical protein [Candidatus Omnitrophota bacterium]
MLRIAKTVYVTLICCLTGTCLVSAGICGTSVLRQLSYGDRAGSPLVFKERLRAEFSKPVQYLRAIEDTAVSEMNARLRNEESSLLMIPIPIGLPTGNETGKILVADIGGTKLGRAVVILNTQSIELEITKASSMTIRDVYTQGQSPELFGRIARSLHDFLVEQRFQDVSAAVEVVSFGAQQASFSDGSILEAAKWPELEEELKGQNPLALLQRAFDDAGIGCRVVGFSGDLIFALIYGRYEWSDCTAAFNLGTGINGAIFVPVSSVQNWPAGVGPVAGETLIPINIELCGLNGPAIEAVRTKYDRQLDVESQTAGRDLFEKMTAGLYLGELARLIFDEAIRAGLLFEGIVEGDERKAIDRLFLARGGLLVEDGMWMIERDKSPDLDRVQEFLVDHGIRKATLADRQLIKYIWETVAARSGRLSAPAATAMVKRSDPGLQRKQTMILTGGVINPMNHPVIYQAFEETIKRLLGDKANLIYCPFEEDAPSFGAAVSAAHELTAQSAAPTPASVSTDAPPAAAAQAV